MTALALATALVGFAPGAQHHAQGPKFDLEQISFTEAQCFESDVSQFPLVTFFKTNRTELVPFGEATVEWEITAIMGESEVTFVSGWFEYTFDDDSADPSTLYGEYLDFQLDMATSEYVLDWRFDGGTGDLMEDVIVGFGQTLGQADLAAGCAEYSFNGLLVFAK